MAPCADSHHPSRGSGTADPKWDFLALFEQGSVTLGGGCRGPTLVCKPSDSGSSEPPTPCPIFFISLQLCAGVRYPGEVARELEMALAAKQKGLTVPGQAIRLWLNSRKQVSLSRTLMPRLTNRHTTNSAAPTTSPVPTYTITAFVVTALSAECHSR